MTRIFGHYVPIEITLLWLTELTLCFALGYVTLDAGIGGPDPGAFDIAAIMAISAGLISFAIGLYRAETFFRLRRLMAKTAIAALLSFPLIWLVGRLIGIDFAVMQGPGALLPIKMLVSWMGVALILRLAFSYSLRMNLFTRRIVILGSGGGVARTVEAVEGLRNGLFSVAGNLRGLGGADAGDAGHDATLAIDQLRRRKVWGLVVAGPHAEAEAVAASLRRAGGTHGPVRIWSEQEFWEGQLRRVDIDRGGDQENESSAVAHAGPAQALVRRVSDVVLSLVLLAFTLPLMLLAAIAIRLESAGPVLYRQERTGLQGHPFVLYKFRSMCEDAERSGPTWAAQRDSRVTRVGAFIRSTRIDELPQLLNVLRGEMSFIGPRPERPHFVAQLAEVIPAYRRRAQVKPGLTGWAQVNYPYGASVEDARMKLSYDLYYVTHRSLVLDVLILFATVRVILFREGAR